MAVPAMATMRGVRPTVVQHGGVLGEADDKWCRIVTLGIESMSLLEGSSASASAITTAGGCAGFSMPKYSAHPWPPPQGRATMAVGLAVNETLPTPAPPDSTRPRRGHPAARAVDAEAVDRASNVSSVERASGSRRPSNATDVLPGGRLRSGDMVELAQMVRDRFEQRRVECPTRPVRGAAFQRVNDVRERRYRQLEERRQALEDRAALSERRMGDAYDRRNIGPEQLMAWRLRQWVTNIALQAAVKRCFDIITEKRAEAMLRRCFSPLYALYSLGKRGHCNHSRDLETITSALRFANEALFEKFDGVMMERLAQRATKFTIPPNSVLVQQGEWVFACFILVRGSMRRRGAGPAGFFHPQAETPVTVLNINALCCLERSMETLASTSEGADLWVLKMLDFNKVLERAPETLQGHVRRVRASMRLRTVATHCPVTSEQLKRCDFFRNYDEGPLASLLDSAEPIMFQQGDRLVSQNQTSKSVYLIAGGGGIVVREGAYPGTDACKYRSRPDAVGAVVCEAFEGLNVEPLAEADLHVDPDEPLKAADSPRSTERSLAGSPTHSEVARSADHPPGPDRALAGPLSQSAPIERRSGSPLDRLREKALGSKPIRSIGGIVAGIKTFGMRQKVKLEDAPRRHLFTLPPEVDVDQCITDLCFTYTPPPRTYVIGRFAPKCLIGLHGIAALPEEETVIADRLTLAWRIPLAFLEQPSHSVHAGWVRYLLAQRALRASRCIMTPQFSGEHLAATLPGISRLQVVLMTAWDDQPPNGVRGSKERGDFEYKVHAAWRRMIMSLAGKMRMLYFTTGSVLDYQIPSFVGICSSGTLEVAVMDRNPYVTRVPFGGVLFTDGSMWQRFTVASREAGCLWFVPIKDVMEAIASIDFTLPSVGPDGVQWETVVSRLKQQVPEFSDVYERIARGDSVYNTLPVDSVLPEYTDASTEALRPQRRGTVEVSKVVTSQLPADHPLIIMAGAEVRCHVLEEAIRRIRQVNDDYTDRQRRAYYAELHSQRKIVARYRQRTLAELVQWRPMSEGRKPRPSVLGMLTRQLAVSPVSKLLYTREKIMSPIAPLPEADDALRTPPPLDLDAAEAPSEVETSSASTENMRARPWQGRVQRRPIAPTEAKRPVTPLTGRDRWMTLRQMESRRKKMLVDMDYEGVLRKAIAAVEAMAAPRKEEDEPSPGRECKALVKRWDKVDADFGLEEFLSGKLQDAAQDSPAPVWSDVSLQIRAALRIKTVLGKGGKLAQRLQRKRLSINAMDVSTHGTESPRSQAASPRSQVVSPSGGSLDLPIPAVVCSQVDAAETATSLGAESAACPGRAVLSMASSPRGDQRGLLDPHSPMSAVPQSPSLSRLGAEMSYDVDTYLKQKTEKKSTYEIFMERQAASSKAVSRQASEVGSEQPPPSPLPPTTGITIDIDDFMKSTAIPAFERSAHASVQDSPQSPRSPASAVSNDRRSFASLASSIVSARSGLRSRRAQGAAGSKPHSPLLSGLPARGKRTVRSSIRSAASGPETQR